MKKPNAYGFTFLELIISLTIISMVAGIIYAALNLGVGAAARGDARGMENQRARAALALISRHLKSAYPLTLQLEEQTAVYFFGERNQLSFISAAGRPELGGLEKITYFLREDRDGRRSLWVRTAAPTLPADLANDREGELRQETTVLPEVENVQWEYLRDTEGREGGKTQSKEGWTDHWDGAEERRLPAAVRLSWQAHLGELPYEWHLEVPLHATFPRLDLLTAQHQAREPGRRRRLRGRAER